MLKKIINKNYFIIIAITILSFVISPGYKTLTSDQQIYFPSILKTDNPELFSGDIISYFEQANFTFFDDLVRLSAKIFNNDLYIATFLLSIIFRFIFFFSVFNICLLITKNKKISILFTIISTITTVVYGTGTITIFSELLPRFTGYSLGFLYLFLLLKNKKMISSIVLGVAVLMHPLAASSFLFLHFILFAKRSVENKSIKPRDIFQLIIPISGVALLLIFSNEGGVSAISIIDPLWESIIKHRDSYIFISSWKKIGYLYLIIDAIILAIFGKSAIKSIDKKYIFPVVVLFLFIPLIMTISHFILADILKISFFAQAQLHRSLIFIKLSVFFILIKIFSETEKSLKEGGNLNSGLILLPAYMVGKIEVFLPIFIFFLFEKFGFKVFNKRKYLIKFLFFILSLIQFFIVVFIISKGQLESTAVLFFSIISILLWLANKNVKNKKVLIIPVAILSILPLLVTNNIVNIKYFFVIAIITNLLIILSTYSNSIKKYYLFPSLIILSFVAVKPYFKLHPINFNNKDLNEVCEIIKDDSNGLVMVDSETSLASDIRMFCFKGIYYSRKDGAQVVFNRDYAIEWKRREELSDNFFKNTGDQIEKKELIEKENIFFVISFKDIDNLTAPVFTSENGIKIWRVKKNEK